MKWINFEELKPDGPADLILTDGKDIYSGAINSSGEYFIRPNDNGLDEDKVKMTHWIYLQDLPLPFKDR